MAEFHCITYEISAKCDKIIYINRYDTILDAILNFQLTVVDFQGCAHGY